MTSKKQPTKPLKNIFFLGCGKMGSILAEKTLNHQLTILEKSTKKIPLLSTTKNKHHQPIYIKKLSNLPKNYQADLVFLTIKPQGAKEILTKFHIEATKQHIFHQNTIFISILAGKKLKFFEEILGKKTKIIRSMPNLPIQYSQGIFPYLLNKNIKTSEKKPLEIIFKTFGTSFEIKDENHFNILTALCGSGPAYIFLLQEILTKIAINSGINKKDAVNLVKKLFLGTSLMSENSQNSFTQLKESVTSKAGITESALKTLQKNNSLEKLFTKTIKTAIKKSQDLENQ